MVVETLKLGELCSCEARYTLEKHEGGHALFFGRCPHLHGSNIANITDIDARRLTEAIQALNNARSVIVAARKYLDSHNDHNVIFMECSPYPGYLPFHSFRVKFTKDRKALADLVGHRLPEDKPCEEATDLATKLDNHSHA